MPIKLAASEKRTLIESAQNGSVKAQYNLGWHYFHNDSFPRSRIRAYIWLTIAISNGYENKELLDKVAKDPPEATKLSAKEIDQANGKAAEMMEQNPKLIADWED